MFIQNKYHKWYMAIIEVAKQRTDELDYSELHHIIPRSLGGLDNDYNLVRLTAREHFICHFLLTKFTTGQNYHKMVYACQGMRRARNYQNRYINSRLYEIVKREGARIQSERFLGKKLSEEHKANISAGQKGRISSSETIEKRRLANTGLKRTEEQKLRMSQKQKELSRLVTPEQRAERAAKASAKLKGKNKGPKSNEHRAKLSEALIGKTKGVAKSEETKQKMSKPKSEEHKKAMSEAKKLWHATRKANLNLST